MTLKRFTTEEDNILITALRDRPFFIPMKYLLSKLPNRTEPSIRDRYKKLRDRLESDELNFKLNTKSKLPIIESDWITPPTKAQLMAGR